MANSENVTKGPSKKISLPTVLKSKSRGAEMSQTISAISITEMVVLGASLSVGGYLLWRNRNKIQSLLEENGIKIPNLISGNLSELLQSGLSLFDSKIGSGASSGRSQKTKGQKRSSDDSVNSH